MKKENNKKSEKRGRLAALIRDSVSLPSDAFSGGFSVELCGRERLLLQGCRRIIKYSTEEMILRSKGFSVSIRGEGLTCTTYHGGSVTVEGRVDGIAFLNEENNCSEDQI